MAKRIVIKEININTASESDLANKLPHIGFERAKNIIAHRDIHGKFNNLEELKKVHGINEAIYQLLLDDSRYCITF